MFRDDLKAALTRAEQLQGDLKRAEGRAESSEDEVKSLREQLAAQQRDLERLRKKVDEQEQARRPLVPLKEPKKKSSAMLVAMIAMAMMVAGGVAGFLLVRTDDTETVAPASAPPNTARATDPLAVPEAPEPPPLPPPQPVSGDGERLNRSQIVAGMGTIRGRVRACFDRFRVPGMAMARVKIAANGRVTEARIRGLFAGTPTGNCIAAAVKAARFPTAKNTTTITYPFLLR